MSMEVSSVRFAQYMQLILFIVGCLVICSLGVLCGKTGLSIFSGSSCLEKARRVDVVNKLIMICSFCSYHNPVCSPIMRPLPSPHSADQGPSLSGTRGHSWNSYDLTSRKRGHPACPVTLDVIRVCGSNIPFQPPEKIPDILWPSPLTVRRLKTVFFNHRMSCQAFLCPWLLQRDVIPKVL